MSRVHVIPAQANAASSVMPQSEMRSVLQRCEPDFLMCKIDVAGGLLWYSIKCVYCVVLFFQGIQSNSDPFTAHGKQMVVLCLFMMKVINKQRYVPRKGQKWPLACACVFFVCKPGYIQRKRDHTEATCVQGPEFCAGQSALRTRIDFISNLFQSRQGFEHREGLKHLGCFSWVLWGGEGRITGWGVKGRTRWLIELRH